MKQLHNKLSTFPVTALSPQGWLRNQLQVQMDGLTGKLYEIWDSVGSYSGWLGGTGENWERAPYYLDGLLPLAHYLGDRERWELCMRFVEWTLASQDSTGNFGPQASKSDYWSRYAMLKVLVQYGEITGDARVELFIMKYLRYIAGAIGERPLTEWSKARVADLIYCAKWLYERQPDPEIPPIVEILRGQALDWGDFFHNFPFPRPAAYYYNWERIADTHPKGACERAMAYHASHIVNVTMGLKYPAMFFNFDGNPKHREHMMEGIQALTKYHGVVSGAVNGDEHLSGNSPSQGAELCSVVEYMFSLQTMLEAYGDPGLADLLERLAYNALPATITEDFMAHQYLQQANQVWVSVAKRNWFNNDETANIYGLEPHFGCCTANMHQGWPKFVKSLWYREGEGTIVSMTFAPSCLRTQVEGKEMGLSLDTEYPFRDALWYRITQGRGVKMALKIRIPSWCENPALSVNGQAVPAAPTDGFITLDRVWNKGDEVAVHLPMEFHHSHWFRDSLAVERGPLVYALDIKEDWSVIREVSGVKDYEVRCGAPWNYALCSNGEISLSEHPVSGVPFSKEYPPVSASLKGRKLVDWNLEQYSAAPVPQSPVETGEAEEELRLIPFGCTKLRVSQFPYYR